METKKYIKIQDLDTYKIARQLSKIAWEIYEVLHWQDKKTMGDQFLRATDSFGANLTEGYGRYHYLDKIKFYYNSRASLMEANDYWVELLYERKKVEIEKCQVYKKIAKKCSIKLQNMISSAYKAKSNNKL